MNTTAVKLGVTNSYLLQTGQRYVLVDTGYEENWDRLCKRLKELNVSLSDISHLVLTHHHDDHCGLLNRLVQTNNGIRIVMSSRAREFLAKGANDRTHGAGYVNRRVNLILSLLRRLNKSFDERWANHPFPPYLSSARDILIQGDTDLAALGIALNGKIIETPGHTTDSISVLLDDGSCFVGDAATHLPQVVGTHYCVLQIEDIDEYYKSWRKLIALGARRIFPAHGKPFAASRLEQNLGKIKSSNIIACT